jgi:uncharacterized protein (TIGR03066 family)
MSIFLVTACGKSTIIGEWEGAADDGLKVAFEFKADGTVAYSNEYSFSSTGTYKVKGSKVTIKLESWEKEKEYKFKIEKNKLSMTAQDDYSPNYTDLNRK